VATIHDGWHANQKCWLPHTYHMLQGPPCSCLATPCHQHMSTSRKASCHLQLACQRTASCATHAYNMCSQVWKAACRCRQLSCEVWLLKQQPQVATPSTHRPSCQNLLLLTPQLPVATCTTQVIDACMLPAAADMLLSDDSGITLCEHQHIYCVAAQHYTHVPHSALPPAARIGS
jgi:hypothetical protein